MARTAGRACRRSERGTLARSTGRSRGAGPLSPPPASSQVSRSASRVSLGPSPCRRAPAPPPCVSTEILWWCIAHRRVCGATSNATAFSRSTRDGCTTPGPACSPIAVCADWTARPPQRPLSLGAPPRPSGSRSAPPSSGTTCPGRCSTVDRTPSPSVARTGQGVSSPCPWATSSASSKMVPCEAPIPPPTSSRRATRCSAERAPRPRLRTGAMGDGHLPQDPRPVASQCPRTLCPPVPPMVQGRRTPLRLGRGWSASTGAARDLRSGRVSSRSPPGGGRGVRRRPPRRPGPGGVRPSGRPLQRTQRASAAQRPDAAPCARQGVASRP